MIDIAGRMLELNMEQQDEILRLRAENEKLRAALKPITDIGLTEARKVGLWSPKSVITMYVNYENLSAAAAALKETGDE